MHLVFESQKSESILSHWDSFELSLDETIESLDTDGPLDTAGDPGARTHCTDEIGQLKLRMLKK